MLKNGVKIFIVDDHDILRDGLKYVMSDNNFANVVAEARSGREFLDKIKSGIEIDIVLLDIAMPEMNGIDACKEALCIKPDLKIIALSMYEDQKYYKQMIAAGIKGIVFKTSGIDELKKAITTVMNGETFFSNFEEGMKSSDPF
jgi:DNA-binding NarL/FixJ family response regulator